MKVYSDSGKTFTKFYRKLANILSWKGYFWFGFVLATLIGMVGFFGYRKIEPNITEKFRSIKAVHKRGYYSLTTSPKKILIDIPFENMQAIEAKRQKALSDGVLITEDDDFVSADIRYQGETIPVKLRLKGDWVDHFESDKWSFRIHTKKDKTFMGMTKFSIQAPETRNYLGEWLFLKVLREHGVIGIRYDFIDVTVNGEHKGIFALEEHFTKEMLEYNKRREAPILKFSEDQLWKDTITDSYSNPQGNSEYFINSPVEAFEFNKIKNDETLFSEFIRAQQKIVDWRAGELESSQVFDYETWSTYLALSNVFGATHGFTWHNLRLYYNPVTDRFEPIPFDNLVGENIKTLNSFSFLEISKSKLFSDSEFVAMYLKKLDEFSHKGPNLISDQVNRDINKFSRFLNREISYTFNLDFISNNQKFVSSKLRKDNPFIAYVSGDSNLIIEFNSEIKIDIDSVEYLDRKMSIDSVVPELGTNKATVQLDFTPDKNLLDNMRVHYSTSFREGYIAVREWPQVEIAEIGELLINHPQVHKDGENIVIGGDIVIDAVYRTNNLLISPGSTIDFVSGGGLIITNQLTISGQENEWVDITSSDKSGQGILVMGTGTSSVNYTTIKDIGSFDVDNWKTSGALSFYNTTININHLDLRDLRAEDSINVVLSEFSIENLLVSDAASDAVDIDFSSGNIVNLTCENSSNDCLDLSGSEVEVQYLQANYSGDKGISVGEASKVKLLGAKFKQCKIGIGVKDSSVLEGDVVEINDTKIPLAVYQKKPEYGPAHIKLDEIIGNTSQSDWIIEEDSSVYLIEKRYWGDKSDVYNLLETL